MSHIPKKKPILDSEKDDDDNKSQSTDSDIISGTFSQLDDNEEEEEKVNSDEEELEEEEGELEEIIEAELEDGEEAELEDEDNIEKVKDKKKKGVKKQVTISNDCLYNNNIDFEEDYEEKEQKVENNKRISINRLTKYERVRIIGTRAKQIIMGSNILVKGIENKTPTEIAELELKHNMIPFKIKRKLPNGMFEIWKLSELEK
jgi:DNA-directed RNA polymerase I, II, and III subunit RPABC2